MKNARPSSQAEGRRRQAGRRCGFATRSIAQHRRSPAVSFDPTGAGQLVTAAVAAASQPACTQADMSVSSMSAVAGLLLVAGDGDGDHYTTFTVQARPNVP